MIGGSRIFSLKFPPGNYNSWSFHLIITYQSPRLFVKQIMYERNVIFPKRIVGCCFFWGGVFFVFVYFFLGPHPGHMQVPRLGARDQIGATAAGLHHSHSNTRSEPCLTYTTAHSNSGSLTHWVRPGIQPTSSWILVGFVTTEPQRELQR